MKLLILFVALILLGSQTPADAKLLQIIHTNDLHSMFEGSRDGRGGYSRVKTVIDSLKSLAKTNDIPSLVLDAGDFGEGSTYYYSNQGVDSFRAVDLLGIDVTVLGNHDYMMGGRDLSRRIEKANFKAHFLSANLRGKIFMGLKKKIKSYVDYEINGHKIRIMGLTTNELHYQYPLLPFGHISSPKKKGIKLARKAEKDNVDLLIALTHIGLENDTELVESTSAIDIVVGGHSHTRLERPQFAKNLAGELVPIVQTGAHGLAVGSMIIDVLGDGQYKLIDYRLYDVDNSISEDEEVKTFVEEAYENRERYFNRSWTEVIGFSEVPLTGLYEGNSRNGQSCWSHHMARAIREKADTDLGFQIAALQGEEVPAGPITFGDLMDNIPHSRNWGDAGWLVARANLTGIVLKKLISALSSSKQPFDVTIDGLMAASEGSESLKAFVIGKHGLDQAIINGEPIKDLRSYSVAFPSEISFGTGKVLGIFNGLVFQQLEYLEDSFFWPLLESYVRKNSPIKCSSEFEI